MAILALAMMYIFPNVNITSAEEAAPISSVMTWSMILDIGAVALSGTIVATLDPTLAYRLGTTSEFGMSSSMVGVWFMISSIVYVVASIPVGWLVDRHKGNTLVFKSAIALGFFALAITFAFLGPLKIPGLVTFTVFDNIYCVGFAMCMKGVGSAVSVNPVYPDLVIGLPEDDEMLSATVSGLWNSAYAIGWALGPVVGGAFYNAFGFDGFCSLMSLLCAVYGVVMLVAALMRVTGGWVQSSNSATAGAAQYRRGRTDSQSESYREVDDENDAYLDKVTQDVDINPVESEVDGHMLASELESTLKERRLPAPVTNSLEQSGM